MQERRHGYTEFDERLRGIELQLERLSSHVESEQGNYTKILDEYNDRLKSIQVCLIGSNGNLGIKIELDRLKQKESEREKNWRIVCAAVVGLVLNAIWGWVSKITKIL